jgi:hypothetical protein
MIKDKYLRLVFIPLLGMLIPLISGIVSYSNYTFIEITGANFYFILTSFIIWGGCNWVHMKMRPLFRSRQNPFIKIFSIALVSCLYGAASGGALTLTWFRISREQFYWEKWWWFILLTSIAILLFTLIYEILFLSKERELDTKIVHELDKERQQAELSVLQNELDPHFLFNSLTTLNHLIVTNPEMAYLYNNRLAEVYKYFLVNKKRELIPLYREIEFIENYFFLLQMRHDNKLQLTNEIKENGERKIMIPPCALQTLVENAIKHNAFSNEKPLKINISLNGEYLKVSNNMQPKPYLAESTKIGLKNLSSRYKMVCNRDIRIENHQNTFLVRLPLISNT